MGADLVGPTRELQGRSKLDFEGVHHTTQADARLEKHTTVISVLSSTECIRLHVCGMSGCGDLEVGVGWANLSCTLCAESSVVGVKYSWFGCWVLGAVVQRCG